MNINKNTEAAMNMKRNVCAKCSDRGKRCGLQCVAVPFMQRAKGAVETPWQ